MRTRLCLRAFGRSRICSACWPTAASAMFRCWYLGGGSNVLFTQDFDGCRTEDRNSRRARDDDGARWLVQVGAGENWHAIVERLMDDDCRGWKTLR